MLIQPKFIVEEIMKKILLIPAICLLCISCNANTNDHSSEPNQTQSQPADWEITASVKKNLMADSSLSSSARMISVTTNSGVVILTGTVVSREESHKVVKIVKSVSGVKSVDNQLVISNP